MKRFTETMKWDDPWFRKLPPASKLVWSWLVDHCDNAGVIQPDLELAAFQIGQPVEPEHIDALGDRVTKLPDGKLHLVKFVRFQFGELTNTSVIHQSILRLLKSHGIPITIPLNTHTQPMPMGSNTHRKRTGTSTGKEKDKEGGVGETNLPENNGHPNIDEVIAYATIIGLSEWKAKDWWHEMNGGGWIDHNHRPVDNWQSILTRVKTKWEADGRPSGPPKSKSYPDAKSKRNPNQNF